MSKGRRVEQFVFSPAIVGVFGSAASVGFDGGQSSGFVVGDAIPPGSAASHALARDFFLSKQSVKCRHRVASLSIQASS